MNRAMVEDLGRLWQTEPCSLCGSMTSERVRVSLGGGPRVLCWHTLACDTRARIPDLRVNRSAERRRRRLHLAGGTPT